MKKLAIIIFSVSMFQWVSAQYCGVSDSSVCVSTGMPVNPGLYPPADSFPAFTNNFLSSVTIQFRNFDTILFGSQVLPVYSLKWDTIQNLPPNLCWSTNKRDNTFGRGEAGCIHLSGLACGPTGQYKLSTLVTVDIGIPVETNGDPGGLKYFLRLKNVSDADIPVNTTQTDSMPFISYGGFCQSLTPPVVGLGPDQTVCANSIVTFNPVVTGGQPPYTYLWQSVGSNIICTTCRDASVAVAQNSTYVLKVTDASGGYGYDTINFIVTGTPYNFQVAATIPTTFCAGGTVTISANANDSVSFQWYRNGSSIPGAVANTFTVSDSSGAYNLVYTEGGFCQATSNIIHLSFYDTAHVTITSIGSDTICVGGAVTLTAIAEGSGLSYAWLANDSNFNYTASAFVAVAAGIYRVVATNQAGCADTSEAVLVVASPNSAPVVSYQQFAGDTLCNNGAVINLTGGEPAGGYYTGSGVSNGVFDPNVGNIGLNFIYYTYTDNTGCGNSVFDTIDVLLCTGIPSIDLESGLQLYPDPCTDRITIQSDILFQSNALISVYDIAGKRMYVNYSRQSDNKVSINISALAAGCYSVQVMADGWAVSKRFIKLS